MNENIKAIIMAGAKRSVQEKIKEGYILLFPELQKIAGVESLLTYYVKRSDFPMFPFSLKADNDRRVYCFSYIYNEKTSEMLSGAACQLSQKASHRVIEDWFRMMDARVTALDVIDECLKH